MTWPVRLGAVPPLADCHNARPETGLGLVGKVSPGETVVLVPEDEARVHTLARRGGTGKTELAAALAHSFWQAQALDLLIWINAASREAILSAYAYAYASAFADVDGGPDGLDLDAAATRFLAWLSTADRPWLVILDDLADPGDLAGLWPQGPAGWTVVTTRSVGPTLPSPGRRIVQVGPFTLRESLAYVNARLAADPSQRLEALEFASDLGCLPLGLAQATAVIAATGSTCRDYRGWFADRKHRLAGKTADGPPPTAEVTGTLAVELASQGNPAGPVRAALALAAILDPAGIPGTVFTSPAARAYIADGAGPASPRQAPDTLQILARVGLLTVDAADTARTVRVHPSVQALIGETLSRAEFERAAVAAADAVAGAWPETGDDPALAQALRDCTARLRGPAHDLLWAEGPHPVLMLAGRSLDGPALGAEAIGYWQMMISDASQAPAGQQPGAQAPGTQEQLLSFHDSLGTTYELAGRPGDAIAVYRQLLGDRQLRLGPDHPDTLATQRKLAGAYRAAGLLGEAIALYEQILADTERIAGPDDPGSLTARGNLAYAYRSAGQLSAAIPQYRRTLADRERVLGPDHPDTLTARGNLASASLSAGRLKEAVSHYRRALDGLERVLGPDHPDALTARGNLASAQHSAGRLKDAIAQYERALEDCERVLGAGHPDTLTLRGNLAQAYCEARRLAEAHATFARAVADSERALGAMHPLTESLRESMRTATGS